MAGSACSRRTGWAFRKWDSGRRAAWSGSMKLLLATHHFYPCIGGIETYVEDEAHYLAKKGIECEVVTLNACSESTQELAARAVRRQIKISRIPFIKLGPYILAPELLRHAMRKDVDAIHCHAMGFFLDLLAI